MGEVPHVENGELPLEKPTLSTFSLEGRVCVVTGGAQGLGLVMSRALVMSGASVALIDLQSKIFI
jgi:D-arabinitol 2-dehydrogenase